MKIELKINIPMQNKKVGDVISLETFKDGTPKDNFWRRRLKDSKKDGCVELVKKEVKKLDTEIKSTLKNFKINRSK